MTTRREFFTQKIRRLTYKTIEIYHPSVGIRRYVRKSQNPVNLTLELSAPRNGGQEVEFQGAFFDYTLPKQDSSTITAAVQLGLVGRELKQELKKIKGAARAQQGELIIREWFKGEESSPAFTLRLFITNVAVERGGAAIAASQDDPANRGVSEIYRTSRFPGLKESI